MDVMGWDGWDIVESIEDTNCLYSCCLSCSSSSVSQSFSLDSTTIPIFFFFFWITGVLRGEVRLNVHCYKVEDLEVTLSICWSHYVDLYVHEKCLSTLSITAFLIVEVDLFLSLLSSASFYLFTLSQNSIDNQCCVLCLLFRWLCARARNLGSRSPPSIMDSRLGRCPTSCAITR